MRRTLPILIVGLLVAAVAVSAIAPAASAHGDSDDESLPADAATNATEVHAERIAAWMTARMGPEGVEAFEQETGASVDVVARAMAEQMGSQGTPWNGSTAPSAGNPGWNDSAPAPGDGYGPMAPGPAMGHGPMMPHSPQNGSYGSSGHFDGQSDGQWDGQSTGQWGGQSTGPWNGQSYGSDDRNGQGFLGGFWSDDRGSGGHGMGGHGMGGGMGSGR